MYIDKYNIYIYEHKELTVSVNIVVVSWDAVVITNNINVDSMNITIASILYFVLFFILFKVNTKHSPQFDTTIPINTSLLLLFSFIYFCCFHVYCCCCLQLIYSLLTLHSIYIEQVNPFSASDPQ